MDRDQIKQEIGELIKKYTDFEKTRSRKEMDSISEANVRADFIDPLFEILGWDILNPDEYDREHFIRGTGFADVALKQEGAPVVFIEAKRFGGIPHIRERGDGDWTMEERQAILYAARSNCKWAILTNFEKFRVFNAATGLTILNFEIIYDYSDRLSELLHLTKDSVQSGRIEKFAEREEKPDVDLEFLGLLNKWRVMLANDIYANNFLNEGKSITIDQIIPPKDLAIHPARDSERMAEWIEKRRKKLEGEVDFTILKDEAGDFDVQRLKNAVQRILDRLIIVRWAEDNLITDDPNILSQKLRDWKTTPAYNSIVDLLFADRALFDKFNDIHNGRIFERGHICEKVKISDEVLGGIIEDMSKRSFRKFDFDILGNTYETYLGHTLHLKEDGTLGLKPSQETRKESGIYYTPPYVVDYIVKNTLGAMLAGKTPEEVSKIRVLDPACGSGSFLIKTFDYFSDYYRKENERIRAEKERRVKEYLKSSGNQLSLDFGNGVPDEHRDIEYDILVNNIHGVDLDEQACEIAAVNLMLKGLQAGGRMPLVLGETIKTGNSLISGGEEELSEYFGEEWEDKKPFNWEDEFGAEGFDVVVGNPPYVFARSQKFTNEEKDYYYKNFSLVQYQLNTYLLFIQQATKLLKNNGYFGFIIPNTWQTIDNFSKFRKFLFETMSDISIVNITDKIFAEANVDTSILIFKKTNRSNGKVTLFSYDNAKLDKIFDGKSDTFRDGYIVRFSKISYEDTNKIMDIIESKSIKLEEIAIVKSGLKAYEVGKGNPKQTKEMKDERIYHSKKQIDKTYYKYLDGKDVCRHSIEWGGNYLKYGECLAAPRTFDLFGSERILVRQIPSKPPYCINATYVNEIYLNDINSMVIYSFKDYSPKLLLSILNSKLMSFWFNLRFNKLQRGLFPQFKVKELKLFPIIKEPNIKLKEELIKLADRMFALNKQLHEINTDFDRYLNLHPRIKDTPLKEYMDALPITDKEVLKDYHRKKPASKIEGKIKEFEITEKGEWLVFRVGYLFKSGKGKETLIRIDAFRCRIEDVELRKFMYYSIKEYTRPGTLGKGNIYERLLAIRLPRFYADAGRNAQAISEIMTEYLAAVDAAGQVEREIAKMDQEIDARVYALYGLGADEIQVVEG